MQTVPTSAQPAHRFNGLQQLTCAFLLLAAVQAKALDSGQPAPDVELRGSAATSHLSDLRGKLVYVDFWASWCGPCRQSFPWMNEMQRKYGARGLQVVGINLDAKRSDADGFLVEQRAEFAVAFDSKGESARRFGVKGMPTSVLIGRDGKVIHVHQGFRKDDGADLEARLVDALGGKTP
jgi:cytochrome c biogenesis protein CcmG, thiol:disulfide interchange protein DsbE